MKPSTLTTTVAWTLIVAWISLGGLTPEGLLALEGTAFEAEGERWTVQPGTPWSYDSRFAQNFLVFNESGERGYAQPAWIGRDPGDLGPLWIIQNKAREVFAVCWAYYSSTSLECMGLAIHGSLTKENPLYAY